MEAPDPPSLHGPEAWVGGRCHQTKEPFKGEEHDGANLDGAESVFLPLESLKDSDEDSYPDNGEDKRLKPCVGNETVNLGCHRRRRPTDSCLPAFIVAAAIFILVRRLFVTTCIVHNLLEASAKDSNRDSEQRRGEQAQNS